MEELRKRTGGGGAFRAYISLAAKGRKRRADLKELAADYREAKRHQSEAYLEAQRPWHGWDSTPQTDWQSSLWSFHPVDQETKSSTDLW